MKKFFSKFGKKTKKELEIESDFEFSITEPEGLPEIEEFSCLKEEEMLENEDWTDIHPDFAKEFADSKEKYGKKPTYQQKWEEAGLTYQGAREWIKAGFKLDDFYQIEKWKKYSFTPPEAKEWIDIDFEPSDFAYCAWLRDVKNNSEKYKKYLTEVKNGSIFSEEIVKQIKSFKHSYDNGYCLTSKQQSLIDKLSPNQELKERYKKYGLCRECNQPNTWYGHWCKTCNARHFQGNFKNWTSDNPEINNFIQQWQLRAVKHEEVLEWIPYKQFANIEHLANGGFSKIYTAEWWDGFIYNWDVEDKVWKRQNTPLKKIVLKSLNDSQEISADLLHEVTCHKLFNNNKTADFIVRCYGISQDPITKNYIMVMDYIEGGNIRQYNNWTNLVIRLDQLRNIAIGLNSIHEQGLIHRDFHTGNILYPYYITDLGLCRPVNEIDDSKVYGVMPYVAPEVLQQKGYTQASDIYSFGIIAYEVLSGLPPYYDRDYDTKLVVDICKGLRPQLQIKIPQLLEDLIKRCWDTDPEKRPTASELKEVLWDWLNEVQSLKEKDAEFRSQLQEAEEFNQSLPDNIKFPKYKIHSGASYHSKLLPTKEITKLLNKVEVDSSLIDEDLKELAREFIRSNKELIKDEKDEEAMDKVGELWDELEQKGLSEESIKKVIEYCKKLIVSEQQTKEETPQFEAKVQQTNYSYLNKNS